MCVLAVMDLVRRSSFLVLSSVMVAHDHYMVVGGMTADVYGLIDLFLDRNESCDDDDDDNEKDDDCYFSSIEKPERSNDVHSNDDDDDDDDLPPFLMTAILAGLYELPPLHILRYQTGWGRRIRYDPAKLVRLQPDFRLVESSTDLDLWRMTLTRQFWELQQVADFDIYRIVVHQATSLNTTLQEESMRLERECPVGLDVSNAGGAWHGNPNLLDNVTVANNNGKEEEVGGGGGNGHSKPIMPTTMERLHRLIVSTINTIESHQTRPSSELLLTDARSIECWVNISRKGSWNRLHTHEGSSWSGVYYVASSSSSSSSSSAVDDDDDNNNNQLKNGLGGRLVLKPTPHPKEDSYHLNRAELCRLRFRKRTTPHLPKPDACEYLDLPATPGTMVVFPSWLHHCVTPLHNNDNNNDDDDRPRISVAFNINFKPLSFHN